MKARIEYSEANKAFPEGMKAMMALEGAVQKSGLEKSLIHLVKLRASQINGCAYCIDMHSTEARADGESEQRLYLLSAWHESPLYTPRERAALTLTESVTLISETHVPDEAYETARTQLSEEEIVKLILLIGTINAWNRLAVSLRYVHPVKAAAKA